MTRDLMIKRAGPGTTIQDAGRFGYLRYGVTPAGPMDWPSFRIANLSVGNDAGAAAIEVSLGGIEVSCEDKPLLVAFCGGGFLWKRGDKSLSFNARIVLDPGDILSARPGGAASGAWSYLAIEGGIGTPLDMGSRATHLRSGIGGWHGRGLAAGDRLSLLDPAHPPPGGREEMNIQLSALAARAGPLRVVPGPQEDYFSDKGLATFFAREYRLTQMADRMAYRFEGPSIEHSRGFNIVSDGVALGGIQVSGDGQPLIQMADRASTGGYPKIGHVIRADIGRLAQMRPGRACHFARCTLEEARAALLALEDDVADIARHLAPARRELNAEMLLAENLIDGFVDARS